MLMHVFYFGTNDWDILELIIQVGILLYIISEKNIHYDVFDDRSVIKKKSDRDRYVDI